MPNPENLLCDNHLLETVMTKQLFFPFWQCQKVSGKSFGTSLCDNALTETVLHCQRLLWTRYGTSLCCIALIRTCLRKAMVLFFLTTHCQKKLLYFPLWQYTIYCQKLNKNSMVLPFVTTHSQKSSQWSHTLCLFLTVFVWQTSLNFCVVGKIVVQYFSDSVDTLVKLFFLAVLPVK